jgi:hypothetical protein
MPSVDGDDGESLHEMDKWSRRQLMAELTHNALRAEQALSWQNRRELCKSLAHLANTLAGSSEKVTETISCLNKQTAQSAEQGKELAVRTLRLSKVLTWATVFLAVAALVQAYVAISSTRQRGGSSAERSYMVLPQAPPQAPRVGPLDGPRRGGAAS